MRPCAQTHAYLEAMRSHVSVQQAQHDDAVSSCRRRCRRRRVGRHRGTLERSVPSRGHGFPGESREVLRDDAPLKARGE
eukprot:365474-Chlamydomonas_euryale.AAC.1